MMDPISPDNKDLYIQSLENRIIKLEDKINSIDISRSPLPDTALLDTNFLKRAFAIWGHYFVAQLVIAIPIYCIVFGFAMLVDY